MDSLIDKLQSLWPELLLLIGAVVCLGFGLAKTRSTRELTAGVAALFLLAAGVLAGSGLVPTSNGVGLGAAADFLRVFFPVTGFVLVLVAAGVPGRLLQVQSAEDGSDFQPERSSRGEFFAFMLLSVCGAMLTAGADDLVWLFLALELTSLPTYVMVATGRRDDAAQEAGVKYFFLGAFAAAIFLYGFALIYGATGSTELAVIRAAISAEVAATATFSPLLVTGFVLAILGVGFKLAAFPMHFYAADVYQGASTPVSAFLAVIPKAAGFGALILLLGLIGWPLDKNPMGVDAGEIIGFLVASMAVLTMTAGNLLAAIQSNVKRMLAYSSVAHSGYLLVPLVVGPDTSGASSGLAALLFYLPAYAAGTVACFAAMAALRDEPEAGHSYDDLKGLRASNPWLAASLAIGSLSLLGLPPLVGFVGKLHIMTSALSAGYVTLIVVLLVNSAISAGYYLRLASAVMLQTSERPSAGVSYGPVAVGAACFAAVLAVVFGLFGGGIMTGASDGGRLATIDAEPIPMTLRAEAE
ncbi:NADH-quinone oxidoreductase subunit N [Mucisphaera calidilacus]|uniref:NADH-quinone oxidoreductase subunit N n=1 Tax=Mucisphaera calidilacus TaxID=2527982 RepID=A0A518BWA8_9BACT|nr:NADH-quinone oxidoreductase subunit N [Mucisphaera calidilacus]QDU71273.1 NADH-quinone oxidoreductase subunit N [Mucisphaera calidilacus]